MIAKLNFLYPLLNFHWLILTRIKPMNRHPFAEVLPCYLEGGRDLTTLVTRSIGTPAIIMV